MRLLNEEEILKMCKPKIESEKEELQKKLWRRDYEIVILKGKLREETNRVRVLREGFSDLDKERKLKVREVIELQDRISKIERQKEKLIEEYVDDITKLEVEITECENRYRADMGWE